MGRKSVLIIGGNGFIGNNLARELVKQNDLEIYSFDLNLPKEPVEGVEYLAGDFFDDLVLRDMIKEKDLIIHAISTVNPGNSNQRFMQGYGRDFIQTVKLCNMLIEQNSNMIFLSSGGTVYGIQEIQPIKETALPVPINHYGSIKLCIENVIRTFNTQLHTKMRIVRIANPYGPGQDYHKGVGFIDAAIKKALNKEPLEIWGNGEIIRDYVYIGDVCKMIKSLVYYEGDEEVFNISTCQGVSQNDVIKELQNLGISLDLEYKEKRSVDVEKTILDNSKIKQIYTDKILTFHEGMTKYYNYIKETLDLKH
ncbi:NAD-dependent epimerase/dehydratase family protein [[Clostridium] scindens]|uniref:NAD-dependent epimerase/dehydratase family protein n=1 Tax=Clostridium scindens (strain JCM 10418 / VPI 12708) TaxID=29347 RepID=UPI001C706DDB|nr:NAD-dependent epimerase/dehydratase family protein [[Clostridium] scindens]QYX25931.1 NAD-dependent epimerase/dehydratase family protein [[Clostridium] scindens]